MSRIARRNVVPVNQVTPLTYRDGVTYIQMLNELSEYVKSILHPSLQHTVDQLVSDVEKQMDKHHDQYVDGVQEFQRIHDAFMSDVNASIIALNDGAVSDLVNDNTSLLGQTLRDHFTDKSAFAELSQDIEFRHTASQQQLTQFQQSVQDNVDTSLEQAEQKLDDMGQRIEDMRQSLALQSDPMVSGTLDAGRTTIVMVGSSTTTRHDYPQELARHIHSTFHGGIVAKLDRDKWGGKQLVGTLPTGTHILNAAWGGSESSDYVSAGLASRISGYNPSIVMHGVGANDWTRGRTPSSFRENVLRTIDRITSTKPIWHVLVHQHESTITSPSIQHTWDDFLSELYEIARIRKNVIVVDTSQEMRDFGVGLGLNDPNQLMLDGSHLNDAGHKILAGIVARKLGIYGGVGVTDTGWQPLTDYAALSSPFSGSINDVPQIRIVSDGGGHNISVVGTLSQTGSGSTNTDNVPLFRFNSEYRTLAIPNANYGARDRFRVGTWQATKHGPIAVNPIMIAENANVHAINHRRDMGTSSIYLDIQYRA